MKQYTPKYVHVIRDYVPGHVLTADEYNTNLNTLNIATDNNTTGLFEIYKVLTAGRTGQTLVKLDNENEIGWKDPDPIIFIESATFEGDNLVLVDSAGNETIVDDAKIVLQGNPGTPAAEIDAASFVGNDLVFTKTNSETFALDNAKILLTGPQGPIGDPNVLSIGDVQKGLVAAASITGDAPSQTLHLTLPQGDRGETGAKLKSAEFVGNDIKFTDTDNNTFNLVNAKITLKGPKGDEGDTGPQGPAGIDAKEIVSVTWDDNDMKFAKDDGATFKLVDAKIALRGPKGEDGAQGPAGSGVPPGGSTGQVLTKNSDDDEDADWHDTTMVELLSQGYVMLTDDDFDENNQYIGQHYYVIIPEYIRGEPVTSCFRMFAYNAAATSVRGVALLHDRVTSMEDMFHSSHSNFLSLKYFNTKNVQTMYRMFAQSYINRLDLTGFNTINVTNMDSMFSTTSIVELDLSSFSTHKVTTMSNMFNRLRVPYLDLSSFNTRGVVGTNNMFTNAANLKMIYAGSQDDVNKFEASSGLPAHVKVISKPMFGDIVLESIELDERVEELEDALEGLEELLGGI